MNNILKPLILPANRFKIELIHNEKAQGMAQSEQAIQNKIIKYLLLLGAVVNKTIGMSKAGWPDIIGVYKGRFIGLEVKRPGQKATKLQEFKLAELKAAGAYVCVATSVSDAQTLLEKIDALD